MDPATWLLSLDIVNGPLLWGSYAVAIVAAVYLLVRPPTPRWIVTAASGLAAGALAALVAIFVLQDQLNSFNAPMTLLTRGWVVAAGAGFGLAVVNLWRSRWWRKAIAVIAVLVFGWTATLGISAGFGISKNLGDLLDISVEDPLDLSTLAAPSTTPPANPLYASWTAPANLPASTQGSVKIPPTVSGFTARDAVVYLPPAALVPNAPALPVVVLMNGQPGSPDVADIGASLDRMAAANNGLAPIVVSVDQLGGDPYNNPLCVDGYEGNAQSYVNIDVPAYIRSTFNVLQDRKYWTIAGFSNGGGCAVKFAAQFPEIWGNLIDISGEIGPNLGSPLDTLDIGFSGDQAIMAAAEPMNWLQSRTFPDTTAIFADGTEDQPYLSASNDFYAAAIASGMAASLFISPGTGHDSDTIQYGFDHAFPVLYPRWGLSP